MCSSDLKENNFYIPITGLKITPMSSDSFLIDYGETVGAGFVSTDKDNLPILEIGVQDYLPKNNIVYIFEIFLIVILALAIIYSFYTIIRGIVRKIRRKPSDLKRDERILMSIGNMGLFFSFLYVILNVLNFKGSKNIGFGLILCFIFSVWIIVYLVRSISVFRDLEKNELRRRMFNTMLCGGAMLLNSFYWQWFKFW